MSKTILITGGAGFVGSNLAIFLKNHIQDARIVCFDNLTREGSQINLYRLKDQGVEFVKGDVRNKNELLALPKVDIILECSAEPSVLAGFKDPNYTIDTNLLGTIHCLELAKRDQAHFIFLSTSRVYPIDGLNQIPYEENKTRFDWQKNVKARGYSYQGITEEFPLNGVRSLYGASKLCSEHMIAEFFDMFEIKGVVNRFGVIAGPWQMGRVDQGIVGYWMLKHKFEGELNYIGYGGSGKQVRDILHVDDVCELILYEINNMDHVHAKTFNVGGGWNNSISLLELTQMVSEIMSKTVTIGSITQERNADIRIYITDNSYVEDYTGWTPKKDIGQVLGDVYEWINQHEQSLRKI